jgi:serine/threonine protein phosphatase PrpC
MMHLAPESADVSSSRLVHLLFLGFQGGVALLIYWISGGMPPTTWRQLAEILPQVAVLREAPDGGHVHLALLFPLIRLLVQSLLLLVAWCMLLWLAVREGYTLLRGFSLNTLPWESMPHASSPQHVAASTPSQSGENKEGIPFPQKGGQTDASQGSDEKAPPLPLSSAFPLDNPFEENDGQQSRPPTDQQQRMSGLCNPFEEVSRPHQRTVPVESGELQTEATTSPLEEVRKEPSTPSRADTEHSRPSFQKDPAQRSELDVWAQLMDSRSPVESQAQEQGEQDDVPLAPNMAPSQSGLIRARTISHPGRTRTGKQGEGTARAVLTTRPHSDGSPLVCGLFLVADGMSGRDDSQFASTLVADTVQSLVVPHLADPVVTSDAFKPILLDAVHQANRALYTANTTEQTFRSTTLTAAIVLESSPNISGELAPSAHVVSVGDSRVYWLSRKHGFIRVTRDHSIVETLVSTKQIRPEERYIHPQRHELFRCLGDREQVEVDFFSVPIVQHDRLLLCSHGLWEMVRDVELARLLSSPFPNPTQLAETLLQATLEGDRSDTISAVVVFLPD